MKRFKLSALFITAALSIAAVGSAAISTVNFDRNAAGKILVDTDDNVAIQIMNISNYRGLVKTSDNGKASINLNEAINNSESSGFNTDAIFTVGTPTSGVIKIKNNSDIPVSVTMNNENNNGITLTPTNSSNATIGVGSASDFYFTINTNGKKAAETLNATVHIEGK